MDGYTLVLISVNVPVNTALNPAWPYDGGKDIKPLTQVTALFYIAYHHPAVPVATFKDLLAYGRAHPGKLYFSSPGLTLKLPNGARWPRIPGWYATVPPASAAG
jgi:tripartite-type tricarboxylate transporter receptor subunit TctC